MKEKYKETEEKDEKERLKKDEGEHFILMKEGRMKRIEYRRVKDRKWKENTKKTREKNTKKDEDDI